MTGIVTEVEKYKRGWSSGTPETPCGSGSKLANTMAQREWIPAMIEKYNINSIADIGAGDLNWIENMEMGEVEYTPYDLVPRHPSVIEFDIIKQVPPTVDCIMCMWVLNHLPVEHCKQAILNIKASGSKYLMVTHKDSYIGIDAPFIDSMAIDDCAAEIRLMIL